MSLASLQQAYEWRRRCGGIGEYDEDVAEKGKVGAAGGVKGDGKYIVEAGEQAQKKDGITPMGGTRKGKGKWWLPKVRGRMKRKRWCTVRRIVRRDEAGVDAPMANVSGGIERKRRSTDSRAWQRYDGEIAPMANVCGGLVPMDLPSYDLMISSV
jgi:hypothetical protein